MNDSIRIQNPYRCPKCGALSPVYSEEIRQYWEIAGLDDEGSVIIIDDSSSYGDADSTNPQFECARCGHIWPADDIPTDWANYQDIEDLEDDEPVDFMPDAEADADVLRSAGWGTDEDYGPYPE